MEEIVETWLAIGAIQEAEPRTLQGFTGHADAEVTLSGSVHAETNIWRSLIAGLTLTLIPAKIHYRATFEVEKRDPRTGERSDVGVSVSAVHYQGILLLPMMPFSIAKTRAIEREMHEGAFCELWEEGCSP